MKLFAVALYAHKNSLWSSSTSYVGATSVLSNNEQEARDVACDKVYELCPESQGWENHQVYLIKIPPSQISAASQR